MGRTRHFENGLTPRQREVLRLIEKGHTNTEIAEKLGISLAGAKWHVSELLSKFGALTREDLAEIMERERRSPGERVRGMMAGLAGLAPLKLTGTSGIVAASAAAVVAGGVVVGAWSGAFTGERVPGESLEQAAQAAPDDALWTTDRARAEAREVLLHMTVPPGAAAMGLGVNYGDLELTKIEWKPGITGYRLSPLADAGWQSPSQKPRNAWLTFWSATTPAHGGDAAFPDARVSVQILMEDGVAGLPLASLSEIRDFYSGAVLRTSHGIAPNASGLMLPVQARDLAVLRVTELMQGQPPPPPVLNWVSVDPAIIIHPEGWIATATPVPAVTLRSIEIVTDGRIARVRVEADGKVQDLPVKRTVLDDGSTQRSALAYIQLFGPSITVIGFDADGSEVARREYPRETGWR